MAKVRVGQRESWELNFLEMTASAKRNVFAGLRALLGLLLAWAAVTKLANPTEFLGSVYSYQLPLSPPLLQFVAVFLPWVELLCGLLLLANLWTESALTCVLGLMAAFLVVTGQAWARRLDISCGCFDLSLFGISHSSPGLAKFLESVPFAFGRNVLLAALVFFLLKERLGEMKAALHSPPEALKPFKRGV